MEQPPPVDTRSYADVVTQTTALATQFSGWQPRADGQPDPGQALIAVFGQFAGLVIDRLNQAPDKNYLAFLNLIGAAQIPPRAARVPLTFHLATDNQVTAVVPAGTLAAAPPRPGEQDEVVFETERPLTITQSQLVAAYVSDTENDTYSDHGQQATGGLDQPWAVFTGDRPSPHQLFLACDPVLTQPGARDAVVTLATPDTWQWQNWPIGWAYWDGATWQPAAASATVLSGHWQVTLRALPALAPSPVGGTQAAWLRAQLDLPLPPGRTGRAPESIAIGAKNPQDLTLPWSPLASNRFYLSADQVFVAGGALATIQVGLSQPGAGTGLQLSWYYQTAAGWQQLNTGFDFADGTSAFTTSGEISFHIPMNWPETIYRTRSGRWLRIDITAGSYATQPEASVLTVGYDWQLPTLGGITVAGQPAVGLPPATTGASPVPPAAACYDGSAIDLSMNFFPFGQEPQFNDVFYVACPDALAAPGAVLTVSITLANPARAVNPPVKAVLTDSSLKIAWEVCDGTQWQAVTVTFPFLYDGQFTVTLPAPVAQSVVNGQQGYWLRARIAAGGYGDPASYEQSGSSYTYVAATYAPPVVSAITFAATPAPQPPVPVTACLTYNDFSYADCTQVASGGQGEPFRPFLPTADTEPALYLGFGQPFSRRSVTLYLEVEPPTPDQVAAGQLSEPDPDLVLSPGPAQLTWEYSSTDGWAQLAAADETGTLSDRGLVTFVGPADLVPRACFGQELCWLRLRWQAGTFSLPPQLRRVLLNTVWAAQVTTITGEILGSAAAEPGQMFTAAQTPVQPGQQLTVRESGDWWVPWDAVADFYQSGPQDRQYTIDPLTGVIQFGNGTYGMIPPAGQNNIRLTYRTGGGEQGNRASGTIVELKSSVPYIDSVTNTQPSQGGAPVEPLDRVRARGPEVLRHRDRAVAAQDLVDLAVAASADVAAATAIIPVFNPLSLWVDPAKPITADDTHLAVDAGRMGVIVVPDEPGSPQPTPSLVLLSQVDEYLRERCPATATLWVAGPEWITVTVVATVVVVSVADADAAGDRARTALARYLHPLTGGPDGQGWPFGRWPRASDLSAVLEAVAGVDHVHSLTVSYQPQTDATAADLIQVILTRPLNQPSDAPQRELDQWAWIDRALVYSGPHDISIVLG
jgi:Baseplate J-like protein